MNEGDRVYLDGYSDGAKTFWSHRELLGRADHLKVSVELVARWRVEGSSGFGDAFLDAFGGRVA